MPTGSPWVLSLHLCSVSAQQVVALVEDIPGEDVTQTKYDKNEATSSLWTLTVYLTPSPNLSSRMIFTIMYYHVTLSFLKGSENQVLQIL
jgi:hypothetical protein